MLEATAAVADAVVDDIVGIVGIDAAALTADSFALVVVADMNRMCLEYPG